MENYSFQNVSFSYPEEEQKALDAVSFQISQGEFVIFCGPSGCGKSTLLRHFKTCLSPHGRLSGTIFYRGKPLEQVEERTQAGEIGFVFQSPDNQVVADKVWHELAFGLESLGTDTPTIRRRAAEVAAFFGIEPWFYKDVRELSGGQKQLLSLASVMVMNPKVLILDEPTSQLDPIAASEFLALLGKIVCDDTPQNPQTLFVKRTAREDLLEALCEAKISKEEKEKQVARVVSLCNLEAFLDRHPYDISGGEQQRTALAKVLLHAPDILLMDEPTKGLDAEFKVTFAEILRKLTLQGVTTLMVSHDVSFCAEYAHRCGLFFDGNIVASGTPRELPRSVNYKPGPLKMWRKMTAFLSGLVAMGVFLYATSISDLTQFVNASGISAEGKEQLWLYIVLFVALAVFLLAIGRRSEPPIVAQTPREKRNLSKRTVAAAVAILLFIPVTIFTGIFYLDDRHYNIVALLVLAECMAPFVLVFEGRKPKARELVTIAVLCAIGIAGRCLFFMLPQFKPILALTIISGVAFGGEAGFLVGAMTMLTSNMLFAQGPWTPWQMFAMGIIGFLAGVLFEKGWLRRTRGSLAIFGAFSAVIIYGEIMNPAAAFMVAAESITVKTLIAYYITGLPMDLIHAFGTVIFILFAAEPMLEKMDRMKVKYGLAE